MPMNKERTHDKIRDEIRRWLKSENCVVHSRVEIELPLSSLNRNDWYYLLKHGKLPKFRLPPSIPKLIYKPSLGRSILTKQKNCVIVDLLGYKEKMTNSFIIKISGSSDLGKEIEKLKKIYKVNKKVIVRTDNMEGEVDGIRIVQYEKFKDWFKEFFLLSDE